MMSQTTLPKVFFFWDYALETAASRIPQLVPSRRLIRHHTNMAWASPEAVLLGSGKIFECNSRKDTNPSVDTSLNHEEDTHRNWMNLKLISIPFVDHKDHAVPTYRCVCTSKLRNLKKREMQSMKDNDVWVLVELPPNARTVGSKWLLKKKTDMDGAVYIFKARLVAKGFTQTYWVDYEETFLT
ncbi:retrotransposon protein, putative, ty1-copia subclass [Tanacetum coccineum]